MRTISGGRTEMAESAIVKLEALFGGAASALVSQRAPEHLHE
jgi:hypothetical protein